MINFDNLPSNKPLTSLEPGTYFGTIEKAEMKTPKDPSKKQYLSITYGLTTKDGRPAGKLFDILTESDHELVRYKLKRFILALELPLQGAFELSDLTKIVVGKKLILDITKDAKSEQPRMVVDMFKDKVFYPVSEANTIFNLTAVGSQINAKDAEDFGTPEIEEVDY